MDTNIKNKNGYSVTFQIAECGNIEPNQDFELGGEVFYLKNISGDTLENVTIQLISGKSVTTSIESGWNCEMVIKVFNAPEGLQYGR